MELASEDSEHIEIGELNGSLGFLLRMAQIKVFKVFFANLTRVKLKPGEFTVLWVIGLNPDLRQGTVAKYLSIKPAHMTKLVARLVALDYVKRCIPEDDRRAVHLSLTKAGQKFVDSNREAFLSVMNHERDVLTEEEFTELKQLLRKIANI